MSTWNRGWCVPCHQDRHEECFDGETQRGKQAAWGIVMDFFGCLCACPYSLWRGRPRPGAGEGGASPD